MPTESSTESPVEAQPAEAVDVKAPADSSSADKAAETPAPKAEVKADKGEKPSILDAVKAALKPKQPDKAPESDKPDPTSEVKPVADGDEVEVSDELTAEENARLKRKTRKRIDDLLQKRAEQDKVIGETQPKAERFDQITKFFVDANISREEVNQLFDVGKNLKNNPRKAYEQLQPIYRQLETMFGDVLPQDLQQQVSRGQISAEQARELVNARTGASLAEQELQRRRQADEERQTGERQQAYVTDVKTKVSEWETSKEKSDPDWKLKQPLVMQAITAELLKPGRKPPTPAEAIEIATKAVADVEKTLKSFVPRPRAVTPITNAASTPSKPAPSSALEAARQGLAKARTA